MEEDLHEMKKRNNQMDVSVMVAYLSKACMKRKTILIASSAAGSLSAYAASSS
jgi:hypothetical protein